MVNILRRLVVRDEDFCEPLGPDRAAEVNDLSEQLIATRDQPVLAGYLPLGSAAWLARPMPEHQLSLLHTLAPRAGRRSDQVLQSAKASNRRALI